VNRNRPKGEDYRIKIGKMQIATIHLSPKPVVIPLKVDSG